MWRSRSGTVFSAGDKSGEALEGLFCVFIEKVVVFL